MVALLNSFLFSALLAVSALAWIDSLAQMLGGQSGQFYGIAAVFIFALGRGALNASRAPLNWTIGLWLLIGGFLAPQVATWVAPHLGGDPLSLSWVGGMLFAAALSWRVAGKLGAHLSARLDAATPSSWNGLLIGATIGGLFISSLGLGPIFFALAIVGLVLIGKAPFPPPCIIRLTAPHAKPQKLLPLGFFTLSIGFGILWLSIILELFDGANSVQISGRLFTFGILILLGAWILGTSIVSSKFAPALTTFLGLVFAFGWNRIPQQLERLSNSEVFNLMTANDLILKWFDLQSPLDQNHWFYSPYISLLMGSLAMLTGAACIRASAGKRHAEQQEIISPEEPLSVILQALALAFFTISLAPNLAGHLGLLAFLAAILGVCFCLWECPYQLKPTYRMGLIVIVLSGAIYSNNFGNALTTGVPFYNNYSYQVEHQQFTPNGIIRVLSKNAPKAKGARLLADGRNTITLDLESANQRAQELLFAQSLSSSANQKLLFIGEPNVNADDYQFTKKRKTLVCDPIEIGELAIKYLDGWKHDNNISLVSKISDAPGLFSCVFINPTSLWDKGLNFFRSSQHQIARDKLTKDGVMAIALELGECTPRLINSINQAMNQLDGVAQLWLLPGEWNKPSLIFTLRNNSSSNNNPFTFQALEQAGLPMDSNDYQSLEIKLHDNSFAGFFHNLSGPLPTAKSRLANTQINQHDHSKIILRAGKCLMYLEQNSTFADSSILPFLNLQLNSQLWDVRDTLPGYGNADQVEVSAASLDSLLKASHAAPDSLLLKGLWRKLGTLLTEKREVQWCWEYFNALCSSEVVEVNQKMVQGLNWQDCELLWVVGNSALEMLEAELALEYAATCLMIDPSFANGYILQGLSYSQLQQWANAARAFRQASSRLLVPNPELLDAWTLAALNAPITQDWSKIYDLYVRHHPEQPINPKLLKQLNLGLLDGDLLRK